MMPSWNFPVGLWKWESINHTRSTSRGAGSETNSLPRSLWRWVMAELGRHSRRDMELHVCCVLSNQLGLLFDQVLTENRRVGGFPVTAAPLSLSRSPTATWQNQLGEESPSHVVCCSSSVCTPVPPLLPLYLHNLVLSVISLDFFVLMYEWIFLFLIFFFILFCPWFLPASLVIFFLLS